MVYLIIGGTGTLGKALIEQIKSNDPKSDIHVISREELKQKQLRMMWPTVKCHLGDVKSRSDMMRLIPRIQPDVVFHLAAMKHVDIAEENPEECMAVNYFGTQNVVEACRECLTCSHVVFSSTDKAVLPINIYGMAKAASEKYLFQQNNIDDGIKYSVFRWGNVLGSRGSVFHSFVHTLTTSKKVKITDLAMTRFFIHIKDVARFMFSNYKTAATDEAMIPVMKAAKIVDLATAVADYLDIEEFEICETGIRRGEKIHECLSSEHDGCLRSDTAKQFTSDELKNLVKEVLEDG